MVEAGRQPIGPGSLVLVTGPSGAGKDALIRAARERLSGDATILFPRRMVTRPASEAEDNQSCSPEMFARVAAAGGFAATWRERGLSYGIPRAVDFTIMDGRSVVCNVPPSVLANLRSRYGHVTVVEVTAPSAILASRLATLSPGPEGEPVAGGPGSGVVAPDVTIVNRGAFEEALEAFLEVLGRPGHLAAGTAAARD